MKHPKDSSNSKKPWEVEGIEWREVRLGNLVKEKPKYGLTTKAKDSGRFVFFENKRY